MNLKLAFEVKELPTYFVSYRGGRKTMEVEAFDGILTAFVQYDYERSALPLNSEISVGDRVEVILMDHRIELYVNGTLKDEEWPAGSKLFEMGDKFLQAKDGIFYIWGHAYEFDIFPERWQQFEEFCQMISGKEDVFYGTNKEVLL